jgi:cell division protein FtsB
LKEFNFDFLDKKEFDLKLLFVIFAILAMSIYIGFLIYGNRGINRLIELKSQKEILTKRNKELRKENVKLQKEYFGLKEIEGDK